MSASPSSGIPNIVIVTGVSGAGKSTALRALEDAGFYAVDNPPLTLARILFEQVGQPHRAAEVIRQTYGRQLMPPAAVEVLSAVASPVRPARVGAPALSPATRILPLHVWRDRGTVPVRIPAGYRPAWEDDRLNPNRANQSVAGYIATQRVWTNTVPRRLLGKRTQPLRTPVIVRP